MLTFVYFIIATIFSATFVGAVNLWIPGMGSAFTLLLIPLAWSFTMTFLANHRREDRDPFDISHLFDGYRNGQFLRIFTTEFLLGIYVFLWSLLFVIPGLIKIYSYRMVPYILADDPTIGGKDAITLSRQMMNGHKWNAFVLDLSFIGWELLSVLTAGLLGLFYVKPYEAATGAELYKVLKNQ